MGGTVSAAAVDRDRVSFGVLFVVGTAAAVLSFDALADLARRCGVVRVVELPGVELHLAWLFPVVIDAFAVITARIWLRRQVAPEAERFARRAAWAAIGLTVAGNGYHGWMTSAGRLDSVLLSAVPPIVLGAAVHAVMLAGRPRPPEPARLGSDAWFAVLDRQWAAELDAEMREWRKPARKRQASNEPPAGGLELPAPPDRSESNEVLADDLRIADAARAAMSTPRGPLSRDEIVERYRVGKTRAAKLRELADAGPPAGGDLDEPAGAPAVEWLDQRPEWPHASDTPPAGRPDMVRGRT
jgi:hypothetical protein